MFLHYHALNPRASFIGSVRKVSRAEGKKKKIDCLLLHQFSENQKTSHFDTDQMEKPERQRGISKLMRFYLFSQYLWPTQFLVDSEWNTRSKENI